MTYFSEFYRRGVTRSITFWEGRVSDQAVDWHLRALGFMVLAALCAIIGATAFIILQAAEHIALGAIVLGGFYIGLGTCTALALRYSRLSGLDIARQYGLPAASWRHVKAKTPAQFDRWLESYKESDAYQKYLSEAEGSPQQ